MKSAYFGSSVVDFINTPDNEIIGALNIANTQFASQWTITTTSWDSCITILKNSLKDLTISNGNAQSWHLFLEYEVPRLNSRIDAVILADDLIFVIEFKYDRTKYEPADLRQVEDYALDLHDFHKESRNKVVIPILLAPLASPVFFSMDESKSTLVKPCIKTNKGNLSEIILKAYNTFHSEIGQIINPSVWENSIYKPTPTIIQAATSLFAGQDVKEISNYGADNLSKTSAYLIDIIKNAKINNTKVVCFVTGVPGAGKTLVGLDIVHEKESFGGTDTNTAYFSGNGPLINVLREALCRDDFNRQNQLFKSGILKNKPVKKDSERKVKSKIQNLHQFIKDGIRNKIPPDERIVVFDEAQRCWDAKQFSNKAKQNQNRESNPFVIEEKSEAELLFEFMSRHDGWAIIIALIGGGQEINTGEGGIAEWGKAIQSKYKNWEIHISPQLLFGDTSVDNQTLFNSDYSNLNIKENNALHLSVSQRSFKAANLNIWVNAVIQNNSKEAEMIAETIKEDYPLFLTKNLDTAKDWLKNKKAGSKRIGLLASSGGLRLKPLGINVREEVDETIWFLNDERDVRSSFYLEITATEYKVQGLEIDWACVCWDADLRRSNEEWDFKNFTGTNWNQINGVEEHQFLLNTYRVLLTRAREGLIIFVPEGDKNDYTRLPSFYSPIYNYLKSCGLKEI